MPAINTNTSALNAQRLLGNTSRMFGRSVARLSSGLRINRAGDDAAGLGIANRISADVRGLRQAARNAEQANSMLQVAEGGVQQIQGIVERMKELATQAASDNSGDRAVLDSEFVTLRNEISRIVGTTEFQGRKMLNGSFGNSLDGTSNMLTANNNIQTSSVKMTGAAAGTYTVSVLNGTTLQMSDGTVTEDVTVAATGVQSVAFNQFGISFQTALSFDTAAAGTSFTAATNDDLVVTQGTGGAFLVSSSGDYSGQDLVSVGQVDLQVSVTGINIGADDLLTATNAQVALASLDTAIDTVSAAFADIGAAQNRIDFARANTDTAIENFSNAAGVIRDADIAAESTEFAKLSIQQQAATAMLAQANAAPQLLLSLLQ